ncbi:MAG TPA: hypothetical protein ENI68_03145 [Gammaproteobacteria bacterium]|nr:hypothetical protein [Gammaproteobacteria bacterium]
MAARGIQVLGLTPHSPRVGTTPETSAVWKIVETWNSGVDDDGIPFREKIYAVFPGFEPSLKDGRQGLHLLFLFDPEIGRECYLKAFDLVMGGVTPWRDKTLQISNHDAEEVFEELHKFHDRECLPNEDGVRPWQYLVLAPHIDADNGLLGAQKSQVLQLFQHGEVAGLELGDNKSPDDTLKDRSWLLEGMTHRRQAFFHSSDAYSAADVGRRYTWMKLASAHVEALRQAFIASDSRLRIAYHRDGAGSLTENEDTPDVSLTARPWLKALTVRGGASFFGGQEHGRFRENHFQFSPDLTCVIGGSMTGKSTLLDGLRVHTDSRMPKDESIREQVEARGRDMFQAGSPEIRLDCPGCDPTAPLNEQWPAVFFAQNELQRLSQDASAIEEILARLVPSETDKIEEYGRNLEEMDKELARHAKELSRLDGQRAEAEQAHERAERAKKELAVFAKSGVDGLHQVGRRRQHWVDVLEEVRGLDREIAGIAGSASGFEVPEIDAITQEALRLSGTDPETLNVERDWRQIVECLGVAKKGIGSWQSTARQILDALQQRENALRFDVDRKLSELGMDAAKLKEIQALNKQASLVESYKANLADVDKKIAALVKLFVKLQTGREVLVTSQREAFDRVIQQISKDFNGRIKAARMENGDAKPLSNFVKRLSERGVTRWWNGIDNDDKPSPERIVEKLEARTLSDFGMSDSVQETFFEIMTRDRRRELAAIRCPDRYDLELRMDDRSYRKLNELSGGQRVSVLLSLLLETRDERPLVIDQPEDELDNRFLFETVLPVLKKLKGRRQVIVATHNANIVVNGDADMVIQLEATAHHGYVSRSGAIEEPDVRDAIVRTVDGGDEAFRLRRLKYGF